MNPLVQLAASALPGERKYILFAGAGVSKDAGVPTAWDLMLETAKLLYCAEGCEGVPSANDLSGWFKSSKYSGMSYADLIGAIYTSYPEQQTFLAKYLDRNKIGEAHALIAELARRNIVRAIITTNFDTSIEQALERLEIPAQVISNDDDLENSEPLIHCKAVRIYKPHGTLGKGALRNTPKDLESLSEIMETELIRITSEHGLVVLGYSGHDPGIMNMLSKRKANRYPLFWVNPCKPDDDIALQIHEYAYLPCVGAGAFIREYLQLVDRLAEISPANGSGPTLYDMEQSLRSSVGPVMPVWKDFTTSIFEELKATTPDFSKFADRDDAIVDQIEKATTSSIRFADAALLASKYGNEEAVKTLYASFGRFAVLCELPEGFVGSYHSTDFDGFKFITCEMLVVLIAALLRYERWGVIKAIFDEYIFIERRTESEYTNIVHFRFPLEALDRTRNARLQLNRISVTSDMLNQRFTTGRPSKHITFKEYSAADYLLFLRTVVHEQGDAKNLSLWNTWGPSSALYLSGPPSFLARAESRKFLEILANVCSFADVDEFAGKISERYRLYLKLFPTAWRDSFYFDASRLGTLA